MATLIAGGITVGTVLSAVSIITSIALTLANRPGRVRNEGPRIGEQNVTSSTLGTDIPRGFGANRVGGNVIWVENNKLREVKNVEEIDGGKGGPTIENTTYQYFFTGAIGVMEGSIDAVLRIWADNKLIYDNRPGATAFARYTSSPLRIYLGTETQLPDPAIEAEKGVGSTPAFRGLAYIVFENLPVGDFGNRIPQFNFEVATTATVTTPTTTFTNYPDTESKRVVSTGEISGLRRLYWVTKSGFTTAGAQTADVVTVSLDATSNATLNLRRVEDPGGGLDLYATEFVTGNVLGYQPMFIEPSSYDNRVFACFRDSDELSNAANALVWAEVDPQTLAPIAGKPVGLAVAAAPSHRGVITINVKSQLSPEQIVTFIPMAQASGDATNMDFWLLARVKPEASATILLDRQQFDKPSNGANTVSITGAAWDEKEQNIWLCGWDAGVSATANGARATLWRVPITTGLGVLGGLSETPIFDRNGSAGAEVIGVEEIDFAGTYTGINEPAGMVFDPITRNLVIWGVHDSNDQFKRVAWNVDTLTVDQEYTSVADPGPPFESDYVDFENQINTFPVSEGSTQYSLENGPFFGKVFAMASENASPRAMLRFDLSDITATPESFALPSWSEFGSAWHDHQTNRIWYFPGAASLAEDPEVIDYDVATLNEPTLTDVITEELEKAGLVSGTDFSFDAGMTATTLKGYLRTAQVEARAILEPLLFAYGFDLVESDFKLKFVTRGNASTRTIPEDDLGARSTLGPTNRPPTRDRLVEKRLQEVELPERVDVAYIDIDRDHLQGNQGQTRHRSPSPTQFSKNSLSVELPIVLTANEAKAIAENRLYEVWSSRYSYESQLPTKHIDLDPTDVIVQTRGNSSDAQRITQTDTGDGLSVKVQAVADDTEVFTDSGAAGDSGTVPAQTVDPPGVTELFLIDAPAFRDSDTNISSSNGGHYIAYGANSDAWTQAIAERSLDGGSSFSTYDISRDNSIWGVLTASVAALADQSDNQWNAQLAGFDSVTQITVSIPVDASLLASTTKQLLHEDSSLNSFVILNDAGTEPEIVRFLNVTDNGDGTYTFDTLIRGARGTENAARTGHSAGSKVVFLSTAKVNRLSIALSLKDSEFVYRAASKGARNFDTRTQNFTYTANDLKPYAPTDPEVDLAPGSARNGSSIQVTWTRRTRLGGENDWLNAITTVPLGEASEAYEIDLYTTGFAAVSATITGITSDSVGGTITDAQRTTAGYGTEDAVDIIIYQVSDSVGRGFGKRATI